jgi:uncharacterized protein YacL
LPLPIAEPHASLDEEASAEGESPHMPVGPSVSAPASIFSIHSFVVQAGILSLIWFMADILGIIAAKKRINIVLFTHTGLGICLIIALITLTIISKSTPKDWYLWVLLYVPVLEVMAAAVLSVIRFDTSYMPPLLPYDSLLAASYGSLSSAKNSDTKRRPRRDS